MLHSWATKKVCSHHVTILMQQPMGVLSLLYICCIIHAHSISFINVLIIYMFFLGSFLNSCGCSTAKSKTPPQETIFLYPLTGAEHGS